MKVALLLIAVLVAVSEARYHPRDFQADEYSSDSSGTQEASTMGPTCPQVCPLTLSPVCVRDSYHNFRLFLSMCMLRKCACDIGYDYVIVPQNMCRDAPRGCPQVWEANSRTQQNDQSEEADSSASE